jgi:MFS family permease
MLTAMNLLNYIDRYIVAALLKPLGDELHLTQTERGWVVSAFLIGYTVFSLGVGWLGDRVPRKYLLACGVGIWSLATFASGLARSFEEMLAARAIVGIGEATYATLAPALISDLFPRERRNGALTIFYTAIPVGAALGYGAGAGLNVWQGWRAAFGVVGLPGLAVALAALGLREPARGASEDISEEERARYERLRLSPAMYRGLLRNRSLLLLTLAMAMNSFALGGLQPWVPTFLAEARDMDLDGASLRLGLVVVVSGLVGTPVGGWLSGRLARRHGGAYFWLPGLGMLLSAPFILAALLAHAPVMIFGCILVGLTLALLGYGPSNAILVNVTEPKIRAAAVASNLFFLHVLGDIPSPIVIGSISDRAGGNLLLGLLIAVPALVLSGVFYCWGARYLVADQEAVLRKIRSEVV